MVIVDQEQELHKQKKIELSESRLLWFRSPAEVIVGGTYRFLHFKAPLDIETV